MFKNVSQKQLNEIYKNFIMFLYKCYPEKIKALQTLSNRMQSNPDYKLNQLIITFPQKKHSLDDIKISDFINQYYLPDKFGPLNNSLTSDTLKENIKILLTVFLNEPSRESFPWLENETEKIKKISYRIRNCCELIKNDDSLKKLFEAQKPQEFIDKIEKSVTRKINNVRYSILIKAIGICLVFALAASYFLYITFFSNTRSNAIESFGKELSVMLVVITIMFACLLCGYDHASFGNMNSENEKKYHFNRIVKLYHGEFITQARTNEKNKLFQLLKELWPLLGINSETNKTA